MKQNTFPKLSKSEAKRLIKAGAVKVNGKVHYDPKKSLNLKIGDILEIGKYVCRIG